jgi:hypothetical protein
MSALLFQCLINTILVSIPLFFFIHPFFFYPNMKRVREEEEEEEEEEEVEIENLNATLESLTEEMRQEVLINIRVTLETSDGEWYRDSDWHLESLTQVSKLLYDSIHGVARVAFQKLVATTMAEVAAWDGYTPNRPLSLLERFPYSTSGNMGLSFPWCMQKFYNNPPMADKDQFPLNMDGVDLWRSIMGYDTVLYESEEDMATLKHYIHWLFHAPYDDDYEEDDIDESEDGGEPPLSFFVFTYIYVRYARFPKRVRDVLRRIEYLGRTGVEQKSTDPVVRFRKRLVFLVTILWFRRMAQPGHSPLLYEWFTCFHTSEQFLSSRMWTYLSHGMLHTLFLHQVPADVMKNFIEPLDLYFFINFFGARPDDTIQIAPIEEENRVRIIFAHPHLVQSIQLATHSYDHYQKWVAKHDTPLSNEQQWIEKAFKDVFGCIQRYAEFVRIIRPDTPLWTYLATELPLRPQDPERSPILTRLIEATRQAVNQ